MAGAKPAGCAPKLRPASLIPRFPVRITAQPPDTKKTASTLVGFDRDTRSPETPMRRRLSEAVFGDLQLLMGGGAFNDAGGKGVGLLLLVLTAAYAVTVNLRQRRFPLFSVTSLIPSRCGCSS